MGTFDKLSVGDTFTTPPRVVTEDDVEALVEIGGYIHPLFADPAFAAASVFGRRPMPGPAVLLLMGGMVEASGRFDETVIALTGFDEVHFRSPAFPGDEILVSVGVEGKHERDGRGELAMMWRCDKRDGATVAEARTRMLFRREDG